MSCLQGTTAAKLVNICANLLTIKTVKEQAESPLLFALVKYEQKQS